MENFYDDWTVTNTKATNKNHEINTFRLSDSINSGSCPYCITIDDKCTLHNGRNSVDVPFIAKKLIQNPSKVLGPILQDNNIPDYGKKIHVNSCVYILKHGSCRNCKEGRFKNVIYKNKNGEEVTLTFCFPDLKKNSNVIPIGFHWDFEMTYKGKEIIDINVFPYDKNNFNNKDDNKNDNKNDDFINKPLLTDLKNDKIVNKTIWNDFKNKILENNIIDKSINDKSINDESINDKSINDKSINDKSINKSIDNNSINDNIIVESINDEENIILKNENKILKKIINGFKELEELEEVNDKNKQIEQIEKLNDIIKNDNQEIEKLKIKFFNKNSLLLERIKELEKSQLTEQDIKKIEKGIKYFSNNLFISFVPSYNNGDF
jgi:hypothetical protein